MASDYEDLQLSFFMDRDNISNDSVDSVMNEYTLVSLCGDDEEPGLGIDTLDDIPVEDGRQFAWDGTEDKQVSGLPEVQVKITKPRKTKYGTGVEAQRTKEHKTKQYKSSEFYGALLKRCGRVSMKVLKSIARALESEGVKISRDAKRLKSWLVEILSTHVPIDKIGDYVKWTMVSVRKRHGF